MPKSQRITLKTRIRSVVIYCVALFLMFYVLADVSVLQSVHGSENVGIPPVHHSSQDSDNPSELTQSNTGQADIDASFFSGHDHKSDEECSGEGECLAGCSHIVVGYFDFSPNALRRTVQNQSPLFYDRIIPGSEFSPIFRPPQTA